MVWIAILAIALAYSGMKWLTWNVTCKAVLLYYAEAGNELADAEAIRKYREKVIRKALGVKEY